MRRLTAQAQEDSEEFALIHGDKGCSCFISPPCSYCTHPGKPLCLEDDSCWEEVDEEKEEVATTEAVKKSEVDRLWDSMRAFARG